MPHIEALAAYLLVLRDIETDLFAGTTRQSIDDVLDKLVFSTGRSVVHETSLN